MRTRRKPHHAFPVFMCAWGGVTGAAHAQPQGLLCAARDIVGRVETPGDAAGVALAGDLAYIADGPRGC
jgi:hypothetical protein